MSTQTLPSLSIGQRYQLSIGVVSVKTINNLIVEVETEDGAIRQYGRFEFEVLIAHGDITLVTK